MSTITKFLRQIDLNTVNVEEWKEKSMKQKHPSSCHCNTQQEHYTYLLKVHTTITSLFVLWNEHELNSLFTLYIILH